MSVDYDGFPQVGDLWEYRDTRTHRIYYVLTIDSIYVEVLELATGKTKVIFLGELNSQHLYYRIDQSRKQEILDDDSFKIS